MSAEKNQKDNVRQLVETCGCTKSKNRISDDFEDVAPVKSVAGGQLLECYTDRAIGCKYALPFGNTFFCRCQERDILFKEYDTLREGVLTRIRAQYALTSVFVAVVAFVGTQGDVHPIGRWCTGVLGVFAIVTIWLRTAWWMRHCSTRIIEIETAVNGIAGEDLLVWETRTWKFGLEHKLFGRR